MSQVHSMFIKKERELRGDMPKFLQHAHNLCFVLRPTNCPTFRVRLKQLPHLKSGLRGRKSEKNALISTCFILCHHLKGCAIFKSHSIAPSEVGRSVCTAKIIILLLFAFISSCLKWHQCFGKMVSYSQRKREKEGSKGRLYMQAHEFLSLKWSQNMCLYVCGSLSFS